MKTFLTGMAFIAIAAFPLSVASMAAAQLVLWVGGLALASVSFR